MSALTERQLSLVQPATRAALIVIARDMFGRTPSFGGVVDDGERQINRGVAFGVTLSVTFGVAR